MDTKSVWIKKYDPKQFENNIYQMWENGGYFQPRKVSPCEASEASRLPFSILLPLPNANDPMHMGHALFTIQDIMIRYHRMKGDVTLWLPGGDHAGIETQFVFEKHLAKKDHSRFDFDRDTLYQMIAEFVEKNKDINRNQMKQLGFSLDWTRYHYSLEPAIVKIVFDTFRKLHQDGLVYRTERLVNYCTKCGTAFSDLEIKHVERKDPLYYIKYGPFVLATTRPETKFGDTAVAFHTGDKRYQKYVGQEITIESVNGSFKVKVIADDAIDPEFGTGIEKVTPAHDALDFEIAMRHHLPIKKVIDINGRLNDLAGRFSGMKVNQARKAVADAMQEKSLIDYIDENYVHNVAVCYKCNTTIEPMLIPQWYVKTKPLAKAAMDAVRTGKTKIEPLPRFEKMYFDWLKNITDWNISRQIVWGPRIPAWYCLDCNPTITLSYLDEKKQVITGTYETLRKHKDFDFNRVISGLQSIRVPLEATYSIDKMQTCQTCKSAHIVQETDTFDTWFLSSQWPFTTLKTSKPGDFEYFYPTSILDTMWDILFFWVARMMMMGIYVTGKVPFEVIHLHCRVVDKHGQKMSKSRGNVVNPIEMVNKYGADALRMAVVFGSAPGSDIVLSEDKIRAMRNFANKLWNIGRFIFQQKDVVADLDRHQKENVQQAGPLQKENQEMDKKLNDLIKSVTDNINQYRFDLAADELYHFTWHEFADNYIEWFKKDPTNEESLLTIQHSLLTILKLLHPFMPFVTEAIWQQLPDVFIRTEKQDKPLIISSWPKS